MSIWAGVDPAEQDRQIAGQTLSLQTQDPVELPEDQVGLGEGLGRGVVSGAVRVGSALDMAAGGLAVGIDKLTGGTEMQDMVFSEHDDTFGRAKRALTPDPRAVTTAGQIGFGLSQALTELAGGGPRTLVAAEQLNTAEDMVQQGVDSTTAQGAGVIAGTANAVGAALPGAVGTTLSAKMISGAGINVATGIAAEGAQKVLLDQRGYQQMADQIDPFDLKARSIDAFMGVAFGGISHGFFVWRQAKNAAATLNLAAQAEGAAPGRPVDIKDATAHAAAFDKAQQDLMNDRPVDVSSELDGAAFTPDPRRQAVQQEVAKAVDEAAQEVRSTEPERFLDPDQVQTLEHERLVRDQLKIAGIKASDKQIKAFVKGTDLGALRDEVTGLYEARVSVGGKNSRITAIERLQKLAADAGADSAYIHADIQNLGGMNAHLSEVEANRVFKAFAEFLNEESQRISGARAVSFRHGGDEISAVVLNATPEMASRAMEVAGRRAREFAAGITTPKGDNLMDIPHPKAPLDKSKNGTGITYAVEQIVPGKTPDTIIKTAATRMEANKNVRAKQAAGAGPGGADGGGAPGQDRRNPGGGRRGNDSLAAGARSEVPPGQEALPSGIDQQALTAAEQAIAANPSVPAIDEATGQHVPAGELLAQLDKEIQESTRRGEALRAAAACFLRNGGV